MQYERMHKTYKHIQKVNFAVCAACAIGIFGTLGGYENGKMDVGNMVLLLILFTALLLSHIFIYATIDYVDSLKRQNRRYRHKLNEYIHKGFLTIKQKREA